MNNQNLKKAIEAVLDSCTKEGIITLSFPEEFYFVERSLIELGYLKGNKNMCAYKSFLLLMAELGIETNVPLPDKKQHAMGVRMITSDRYPWKADGKDELGYWSDTETERMANERDLPRWRLIFTILKRNLE